MRCIGNIFLMFSLALRVCAQEELPLNIANYILNESYFEKREPSASKEEAEEYLIKNWRSLSQNWDLLPKGSEGSKSEAGIYDSSLTTFAEVCENLPPLEYVEFLKRIVEACEQKIVSLNALHLILLPDGKKSNFLSVNWEHPQVHALLIKAKQLVPPEDEAFLRCLDKMASGALADNYMLNRGDDEPRPETLPGIKLKRPWDSLIKKYERITGKKVEDPHAPRADKRNSFGERNSTQSSINDNHSSNSGDVRAWTLIGITTILLAIGLKAYLRR